MEVVTLWRRLALSGVLKDKVRVRWPALWLIDFTLLFTSAPDTPSHVTHSNNQSVFAVG